MSDIPWRPGSIRRPKPVRAAKIPLTREQIVRAGLRIVQREGIDAVSMRRIASEFETGPSSLYAHVTNKDELLQLMFDEVCGTIAVPGTLDRERWKDQVKELARAGHQALLEYNDLARAAMATIPSGPNALRVSNAMLGMMLTGGIPPKVAGWALDRIFLYITADAYEYSLWRTEVKDVGADGQTYIAQLSEDLVAYFGQLSPQQFPFLHKYADAMVGGGIEARFEFGLDMLVDGLDKYASQS